MSQFLTVIFPCSIEKAGASPRQSVGGVALIPKCARMAVPTGLLLRLERKMARSAGDCAGLAFRLVTFFLLLN
ncbi:hypothetical protein BSFA1_80400 (plasmid) [Burkholderia sp. SFA1]|nr:hypothetical protein BSFA1_80400 [Burkholderia sp. SFA1]